MCDSASRRRTLTGGLHVAHGPGPSGTRRPRGRRRGLAAATWLLACATSAVLAGPAEAQPPTGEYWAWVRTRSAQISVLTPGEQGSSWSGGDGAITVTSYWPGGYYASPVTFTAEHKWKMPMWLPAGQTVEIPFSIEGVQYRQHDTSPGVRGYTMSTVISAAISPPGADWTRQYEDFAGLNKSVYDGSPDYRAPTPAKSVGKVAVPKHAPGLEGREMALVVRAGKSPGPVVAAVYTFLLRRVAGPPPEPPDAPRAPSPCAGVPPASRQAALAAARQRFMDGLYLKLDYLTASGLRKAWWVWDDFKEKWNLDEVAIGRATGATFAEVGAGAAGAVFAAGVLVNTLENAGKSTLRTLDRTVAGDRLIENLEEIYRRLQPSWEALDNVSDPAARRAMIEQLAAQENKRPGNLLAAAPYETVWERAGSDMSCVGFLLAELYNLHRAEKEAQCR